jgi:hypothetical protein
MTRVHGHTERWPETSKVNRKCAWRIKSIRHRIFIVKRRNGVTRIFSEIPPKKSPQQPGPDISQKRKIAVSNFPQNGESPCEKILQLTC